MDRVIKNKFFKTFILLTLLLLFLFAFIPSYNSVCGDLGEDLKKEQEKLKELKKQLDLIKQKITQNNKEKLILINQLSLLNIQLDTLEDEIKDLENKLISTEKNITFLEADIKKREKDYNTELNLLKDKLSIVYKIENTNAFYLFFSNKDLNNILEEQNIINFLIKDSKKSLKNLLSQKISLEGSKYELVQKKYDLEKIKKIKMEQDLIYKEQKQLKEQTLTYLYKRGKEYKKSEEEIHKEIEREEKIIEEIIKKIEAQKKAKLSPIGSIIWPTNYRPIKITSNFGYRIHPITGLKAFHKGIDIGIPNGTPIVSIADGLVIFTGYMAGYGNVLIIQHGSDVTTVCAHLKSFLVKENQMISKGQIIALSDNTGWSTGPHLHFEIRVAGEAINPLKWLPGP